MLWPFVLAFLFLVSGATFAMPQRADAAQVYSQTDASSFYGIYTGGGGSLQNKNLGSNILVTASSTAQVYASFRASGENGLAPTSVELGPWFSCWTYPFTTDERNAMIANPGTYYDFENRSMIYQNDCSSATTTQFMVTVGTGGNDLASNVKSNASFVPYLKVSVNELNPPDDDTTRFIEFYPAATTTASSTFNTGAKVYINPDDSSGLRLLVEYFFDSEKESNIVYTDAVDASDSPLCSNGTGLCLFDVNLDGFSGEIDFSRPTRYVPSVSATSTIGVHSIRFTLEKSCYFFFHCDVVVATHTFTIVELSNYDKIQQNIANGITDIFSASSTVAILTDCDINFLSFNPIKCLYSLVIPSEAQFMILGNSLREGILSKVPFAYGYQIYQIFDSYVTGTATAIPNYAITFPSDSPIVQSTSTQIYASTTITFINWSGLQSMVQSGDYDNFLGPANEIVEACLTLIFAFWLFSFIKDNFI